VKHLINIIRGDEGQGLTEYGLLLGAFVIAVIGALMVLGPKVQALYSNTESQIN